MKLIVANWKMNPDKLSDAKSLFSATKRQSTKFRKSKVVICPPSIYIQGFSNHTGTSFQLGAQDVFHSNKGSFTGKVSTQMLVDLKVTYVIVGHSETRSLGETDKIVAKKVKAVLESGMTAILCIGESERDDDGNYLRFLEGQIKDSLSGVGKKYLKKIFVAYEPIWAIGKKADESVSPQELHQMTIFIRKTLAKLYGKKYGLPIPILYGGSVEPENSMSLIYHTDHTDIAGFLVGHASLDPKHFGLILETIEKSK